MSSDEAVVAGADVGDHSGAGKQAHVPLKVLDLLDVEPGDRVVFVAHREGGIRIERGEPLSEASSEGWRCPTCGEAAVARVVGTSPHIETGEPVLQMECSNCRAVSDESEWYA